MNTNICNNCGGNYENRNGRWICLSCGAYKPETISNEEITLLYTAFQKLRLAEFSEAEQEFDDILRRYPKNANAYWGRLMSKYGIKYEQDYDGKMIPTCYAASIESILEDKDYQNALKYADQENKAYYQQQAEYMERVRVTWVEKAKKEDPYDIFICYKDSDLANGIERTKDSIEAHEIYTHLLEKGYRVFFSRESLRDKMGEKYEPYIFNALSTAKVMLVYGTSAEYIKSTWLKNEWHRFTKRILAGEKHADSLLVACKGFDPNELPTALASKQCFDASRQTFFGDLDHSIERIIRARTGEGSDIHEHFFKTKIVKPTCREPGYTVHSCDCGYEYKDSYLPALGHQFSKWVEILHPTCTVNGEEQRKCERCGEMDKRPIPATGHQFSKWSTNADGRKISYCPNCGATKDWEEEQKAKEEQAAEAAKKAQTEKEAKAAEAAKKAQAKKEAKAAKAEENAERTEAIKSFFTSTFGWGSIFFILFSIMAFIELFVDVPSGVPVIAAMLAVTAGILLLAKAENKTAVKNHVICVQIMRHLTFLIPNLILAIDTWVFYRDPGVSILSVWVLFGCLVVSYSLTGFYGGYRNWDWDLNYGHDWQPVMYWIFVVLNFVTLVCRLGTIWWDWFVPDGIQI